MGFYFLVVGEFTNELPAQGGLSRSDLSDDHIQPSPEPQ
jgi:hypothetical protein